MDRGIGHGERSGPGRQDNRDFGQLPDGRQLRPWIEADLRQDLLGDGVSHRFDPQHRPPDRSAGPRPKDDPRRQASGNSAGAGLVESGIDPKFGGVDHLDHGLACDNGCAWFGQSADDQAGARRGQAKVRPLLDQGRALRVGPLAIHRGGAPIALALASAASAAASACRR